MALVNSSAFALLRLPVPDLNIGLTTPLNG